MQYHHYYPRHYQQNPVSISEHFTEFPPYRKVDMCAVFELITAIISLVAVVMLLINWVLQQETCSVERQGFSQFFRTVLYYSLERNLRILARVSMASFNLPVRGSSLKSLIPGKSLSLLCCRYAYFRAKRSITSRCWLRYWLTR